ncbi:phage repressor protein [Plesiomonas shigelloides]|uniref:phage repressor protein CI n=1 Tax=Plesiomonas shigelloides TaxID=703 RepID=UPI0012626FF9|nr:phage repressor protein CI [Plesiomonas shigelloides]KAB7697129.1 phage repressor protein [Plesiomonas shigelloides]
MIQNWKDQQEEFTKTKVTHLPDGGKEPIERIMAAYGFTSRLALCRHLNVSQSTMANRVSRGNFPADWVLICAMETGAAIEWLVYGHGTPPKLDAKIGSSLTEESQPTSTQMSYSVINNGVIQAKKFVNIASELLPQNTRAPRLLESDGIIWVVDDFSGTLVDGVWLIEMDKIVSIREIYRLPGERIRIENGKASFECSASEITVLGKAISKTEFFDR